MIDVLCYGSIVPDRVLRLPHFPQPGEGVHALGEALYLGGEPSNVGGHLAAWGANVAIAGNNIGTDALGVFVRTELEQRFRTNILIRSDDAIQTPTCYIWTTPDGERTMVPSWSSTTGYTLPDDTLLQTVRLVSASVYGPGMAEMLQLARQHSIPLAVADLAGPDDPRLPGAVIVTSSRSVLARRHGVHDVAAWMRAVHDTSGALVVVSNGANTVLACTNEGRWLVAQPPSITPIDTTGAGDALKAGLIWGWLRGWPIQQALKWSVAVGSLACLRLGAGEQPASVDEIEHVMPEIVVEQREIKGEDV